MRLRLFLVLALATGAAGAQDLRDALSVGDLICEFGARSLIGELAGAPPGSDLLLVYESVTRDAARVVSTHAPGRRPVLVRATGKAVHFIERVGPSVRVTTLTGCERRKLRDGAQICVRFAAQHAWHFDERAFADPDLTFAQLPSGATPGRCEPWQID